MRIPGNTLPSWAVALFGALHLTACGSGGGGDDQADPPANPADAAGIWQGSASVAGSSTTYGVGALVTSDGHARIYLVSTNDTTLGPTVIEGDLRDSAGSLGLVGAQGYSISSPNTGGATGTFDGAARSNVTGTLTFGGQTYHVDLAYSSQYERASSLATVTGTYQVTRGTYSMALTIASTGAITGNDSTGCTFSGTVSADLPAVNAYALALTGANCSISDFNGTFNGRMALMDSGTNPGSKVLVWFAHSTNRPLIARNPEK